MKTTFYTFCIVQLVAAIVFVVLLDSEDCGQPWVRLWLGLALLLSGAHVFLVMYRRWQQKLQARAPDPNVAVLDGRPVDVHAFHLTHSAMLRALCCLAVGTGIVLLVLGYRGQPSCVWGPQASPLFGLLTIETCGAFVLLVLGAC